MMTSICIKLPAQDLSLSTDVLSYVDLVTVNGEMSYSLAQHWSANIGFRYNPFTFKMGEDSRTVNNRQRTISIGGRYWFWHVYSGWWLSAKAQYQEYNKGGWRSPETREGDRYGLGLAAGYSYMLTSWLNLEFSAGLWGGRDIFRVYDCPQCGVTVDEGEKYFVLPHDITLALSFIF